MCILCQSNNLQTHLHPAIPAPFDVTTITYELGESRVDAPAGPESSYTIEIGDSFDGYLSAGDLDWIGIAMTAGTSYEFGLIGGGNFNVENPSLTLRNDAGFAVAVGTTSESSQGNILTYTAIESGVFWLEASSLTADAGAYTLVADEDSATAILLEGGASRRGSGFISGPQDIDSFKFELRQDYSYDLMVFDDDHFVISDTILKLYAPNGTLVAQNDDAGGWSNLSLTSFNPTQTGTYTMTVEGKNGSTGSYEALAFVDFPKGPDTTWTFSTGYNYLTVLGHGDVDTLGFEVTKGETYSVTVNGVSDLAVEDTFVRVLDRNGRLEAKNDNANSNSTFSYLEFTADYTGKYYLDMKSRVPEQVGLVLYSVSPNGLQDPLDALTWADGSELNTDDPIRIYLAPDGSAVNDEGVFYTSLGFTDQEQAIFHEITQGISRVADITFEFVDAADTADFQIARSDLNNGDLVGFMAPQGSAFYSDGVGLLDDDLYWTPEALQRGGLMYAIIVHELGHGLGLAHPHDFGGDSGKFLGVIDSRDLGHFDLNQAPFTAMSYNEWWEGHGSTEPKDLGSGYLTGFGALDIAALQAIYGANTSSASGNNTYRLDALNGLETIWDTGGSDTIRYSGDNNAQIDLRSTNLGYETAGGGRVSSVENTLNGMVLAQGVEIENAIGGKGHDLLIGNDLANVLEGRKGRDILHGGSGKDELRGSRGKDTLYGDDGKDKLYGGSSSDKIYGGGAGDLIYGNSDDDLIYAGDGNDKVYGGTGHDWIDTGTGTDTAYGGKGDDYILGGRDDDDLYGDGGDDILEGGDGGDQLYGGSGNDTLRGGAGLDRMYGEDGDDLLEGGDRADALWGGAGNDILSGGASWDALLGGVGDDELRGGDESDTLLGGDGKDYLRGDQGDDSLDGGNGNDRLLGGTGDDTLLGKAGDDLLFGDEGNDEMSGHDGADSFVFRFRSNATDNLGHDRIIGFTDEDRIDLSGMQDSALTFDALSITRLGSGNTLLTYDSANDLKDLSIEFEDLQTTLTENLLVFG